VSRDHFPLCDGYVPASETSSHFGIVRAVAKLTAIITAAYDLLRGFRRFWPSPRLLASSERRLA
jgi:hypothetical protein